MGGQGRTHLFPAAGGRVCVEQGYYGDERSGYPECAGLCEGVGDDCVNVGMGRRGKAEAEKTVRYYTSMSRVSCAAHCGSGTCMAFVGLALYIGMRDSMHQSSNEYIFKTTTLVCSHAKDKLRLGFEMLKLS
jgi:hypothetical protein